MNLPSQSSSKLSSNLSSLIKEAVAQSEAPTFNCRYDPGDRCYRSDGKSYLSDYDELD